MPPPPPPHPHTLTHAHIYISSIPPPLLKGGGPNCEYDAENIHGAFPIYINSNIQSIFYINTTNLYIFYISSNKLINSTLGGGVWQIAYHKVTKAKKNKLNCRLPPGWGRSLFTFYLQTKYNYIVKNYIRKQLGPFVNSVRAMMWQ